ncbi:unnamed protein product, partial [Mesorhabditis belari]|uniref:LSM12 LSM domain-containing protein n=1 Tax=Mesorhabditis belari TaxID=2138241 RepID=A0AAF3EBX8_9BILA
MAGESLVTKVMQAGSGTLRGEYDLPVGTPVEFKTSLGAHIQGQVACFDPVSKILAIKDTTTSKPKKMNDCYVGAATGCLKALSLSDNAFLNLNNLKDLDPKRDEITRMVFGDSEQNQLLFSTSSREIRAFDTTSCQSSKLFDVSNGAERLNGLYLTPNDQLVVSDAAGHVTLHDRKGQELSAFKGGQGLLCLHGDGDRIAVPPDNLAINVPIWDMDIRLVPDSETLITGTGTHMIRMYDMRAQRRPVRQVEWMESPVTALSLSYRDHQVFAGNTIGEFGLFDLRGKTKIMLVCKFKGQAGAIRAIYGHPTAPYVASCGIDRFARVHDMNSKKLVSKVYCKARLNCVLLRDGLSIMKPEKKEEEDVDGDWEQIKEAKAENESGSESDGEGSDIWDEIDDEDESGSDQGDEEQSNNENDMDSSDSEQGLPSPPTKKRRVTTKKPAEAEVKEEMSSGDEDDDVKVISATKRKANPPKPIYKGSTKVKQGKRK